MKKFILFLNSLLLLDVFIQSNAHAYIDPGAGTIILQALIGGIVTTSAAVSLYWRKLKSFEFKLFY